MLRLTCQVCTANLHIAGTPCTDFSPRGAMKGLLGVTTGYLFCWMLQRLLLEDDYALQENVASFTTRIISDTLGHMYHVEQTLLDPRDYGWPVARVRKYTVLMHKAKTGAMRQPLNVFARLFHRSPIAEATSSANTPAWDIFLIAGPSELKQELMWAASRPHSSCKEDSSSSGTELDPLDSTSNGSFWQALTPSEQGFLQGYQLKWPGQVFQLNQNPAVTATTSEQTHLATLIKNSGILWQLGSLFEYG